MSFEHCVQLDVEGAGQLLAAKSWLSDEKNDVPEELKIEGAMKKEEILQLLSVGTEHLVEQLSNLLESRKNRKEILNMVARQHSLEKEYDWTTSSGAGFPIFETTEDPSINFNVLTGKLEKGGIDGKFETPLKLQENAFFKTLFEGAMPEKLTRRSDRITYEHETEEKVKYIFKADERTQRFSGNEIKDKILREFDGVRCAASWVDKKHFKTMPVSLEGCIQWTCANEKAVHVTSPSGMEMLHLTKNGASWRACAPWNVNLQLVDVKSESRPSIARLLGRIEHLNYMFIFAKAAAEGDRADVTVEGVWLPRLGLNFSGPELVEPNLQNFGVCGPSSFDDATSGGGATRLAQFLGDFDRYLPLCQGKGTRFRAGALLPYAEFKEQDKALESRLLTPTDGSAFLPPPQDCRTYTLRCIKFYYYEMPRDDGKAITLKPQSTSIEELVLGYAYLSTVLLSEGRYSASHRHLYLLDRQLKVG